MSHSSLILSLAATCLLAACSSADKSAAIDTPPSTLPEASTPAAAPCDPVKAQWAIGKTGDDALLAKAQADTGAKVARFLKPNQAITMEYNEMRLNIGLNDKGIVDKVGCG